MVPGVSGQALQQRLGKAAAAVQQLLRSCASLPQYHLLDLAQHPLLASRSFDPTSSDSSPGAGQCATRWPLCWQA